MLYETRRSCERSERGGGKCRDKEQWTSAYSTMDRLVYVRPDTCSFQNRDKGTRLVLLSRDEVLGVVPRFLNLFLQLDGVESTLTTKFGSKEPTNLTGRLFIGECKVDCAKKCTVSSRYLS